MWGVPINHEYFNNTNSVQWMWYYYNYMKDHDDLYTRQRSMLEYHASFTEPERVSKVIENRGKDTNAEVIGTTDDAEFNDSIKEIFGRDAGLAPAPKNVEGAGEVHHIRDAVENMVAYEERKAALANMPAYNYLHWVDFNLE